MGGAKRGFAPILIIGGGVPGLPPRVYAYAIDGSINRSVLLFVSFELERGGSKKGKQRERTRERDRTGERKRKREKGKSQEEEGMDGGKEPALRQREREREQR